MIYRPEIDGLRAIAVVPVLLYHAGFGCPGGYSGVDVFFVISGFLIGSLILNEGEAGSFRYARFWMRRLRRLFPAWATVLLVTTLAACLWLVPPHLEEFGRSLVAQPLLGANFHFWGEAGYFETDSEFKPLLHTWSLAVEEQFYVLLPLVLLPLLRWSRRLLLPLVVVSIVVSFLFSLWASVEEPSLAFFLLPARIWELDLGVLLALMRAKGFRRPWLNEGGTLAGLVLVVAAYAFFDQNTAFPGPWAALPCLGTFLILFSNSGALSWCGRALAAPPLVWIGKISYPLYLWHWPVLVFVRYLDLGEPPATVRAAALLVSVLLAWATYEWIERPIRSGARLASPRRLGVVAVALSALLLAVGMTLSATRGLPKRFSPEVTDLLKMAPRNPSVYDISDWERRGGPCLLGDPSGRGGELLLWGDSHALAMADLFDELGKKHGVRVVLAAEAGVAPLPGTFPSDKGEKAMAIPDSVWRYLDTSEIRHVVFVAKWPLYFFGRGDGERDRLVDEPGTPGSSPASAVAIFERRFRELLESLGESGRKAWVMRPIAMQPRSVPETLAQLRSRGKDLNALALPASAFLEQVGPTDDVLAASMDGTAAQLLDPAPYFLDGSGRYRMAQDGRSLYRDRDHLSSFGARQLIPMFEPIFEGIAR